MAMEETEGHGYGRVEFPDLEPVPQKLPASALKSKEIDWEVVSDGGQSPNSPVAEDDLELECVEWLSSEQVAKHKSTRSMKSNVSSVLSDGGIDSSARLYKPPTWMKRLLTSKVFLISNVFIILLNMMWTGFYADSLVEHFHEQGPISTYFDAYFVIESIFTGCFLLELLMRLIHFASFRLWHDLWLCFDIIVIVTPAVEIWILRPTGWATGSASIAVVNIFRVFRVSRGVALLASINWFRPMYLAAIGFKHSLASLLVVAVYMGTLLFTASLILCNLLGPISGEHATYPDIVRGRFRSVNRTYLTLSECLLGGIEWGPELVDLILFGKQDLNLILAGIFLFVVLIVGSLLWMHTIAGIFMQQVDRSFEVTDVNQFRDPEFKAATKEILQEFIVDLKEMDQDQTQSLSWRQISLVVTHHLELLSDLGIRMPEAKRIYAELDMNNTGYVSIPMFIGRLIENLKYKTIETLIFENQQWRLLHLMKKLARLNLKSSKKVMEQLKAMSSVIAQVEAEETLQSAVQRRLARQKQRVTCEKDQFDEALITNIDLISTQQKTASRASLLNVQGVSQRMDGYSFVLDCWNRSVDEQKQTIRALVNPKAAEATLKPR